MLRGNGGDAIFADRADRTRFLLLLQSGIQRYQHRVHAYCLMDNHVHLAVQVAEIPLSKIIQNLAFRYTQYFNRREQRTGHLFQGRFKALLVDADTYLLELVRYIHLNPLRAGMVNSLQEYPWSSHRAYLDLETTPWLTTDYVLGQLAEDRDKATARYQRFIQDGMSEGHRAEFHRGNREGRLLGSDDFIEQALARAGEDFSSEITIEGIINTVCAAFGLRPSDLSGPGRRQPMARARAIAAWLTWRTPGLQLTRLADRLRRDLTTLSQAAHRIEQKSLDDSALRETLAQLERQARKQVCQA
ncbi:transposase [Geothermobacter ehrlichii]|nr:transposase [Geothermobacter ehrlichii]